jgi:hypothetical protein
VKRAEPIDAILRKLDEELLALELAMRSSQRLRAAPPRRETVPYLGAPEGSTPPPVSGARPTSEHPTIAPPPSAPPEALLRVDDAAEADEAAPETVYERPPRTTGIRPTIRRVGHGAPEHARDADTMPAMERVVPSPLPPASKRREMVGDDGRYTVLSQGAALRDRRR